MTTKQCLQVVAGAAMLVSAAARRSAAQETCRSLTPEEARAALHAAAEFQERYQQVVGVFRVRYEVNQDVIPDAVKSAQPNLTYNGGIADATLRWWRDGTRQRLETIFDLPDDFKRFNYEDTLLVNDDEMQVVAILRTRQVAVVQPGALGAVTPAAWLLAGSQIPLGRRVAEGATITAAERPDGKLSVRIAPAGASGEVPTEYTLDPDWDYAVTGWSCADGTSSGSIDYARDQDGTVLPTRATLDVRQAGTNDSVRRSTLYAESVYLGPPEPEDLRFDFKPGLVFTDNRDIEPGGSARTFRVRQDGTFEQIPRLSFPAKQWGVLSYKTLALGVIVALGVAVSLAARVRAARTG